MAFEAVLGAVLWTAVTSSLSFSCSAFGAGPGVALSGTFVFERLLSIAACNSTSSFFGSDGVSSAGFGSGLRFKPALLSQTRLEAQNGLPKRLSKPLKRCEMSSKSRKASKMAFEAGSDLSVFAVVEVGAWTSTAVVCSNAARRGCAKHSLMAVMLSRSRLLTVNMSHMCQGGRGKTLCSMKKGTTMVPSSLVTGRRWHSDLLCWRRICRRLGQQVLELRLGPTEECCLRRSPALPGLRAKVGEV